MDRVHTIRWRPQGATFNGLLARLRELNDRAAIVDPEGPDKTMLLEGLDRALTQEGIRTRMVFVNDFPLERNVLDVDSAVACY